MTTARPAPASSPAKPPPSTTRAASAAAAPLPSSSIPSSSSLAAAGYTRLHITPFDAELLPVVLPASVRPDARNISFHSVQTFPEKRYGYVDLPTEAADRLRRKLNGAVLKGVKIRLEPARQLSKDDAASRREGDGDMGKDKSAEGGKKEKQKDRVKPESSDRKKERKSKSKKVDKDSSKWEKLDEAKSARQEIVGVQLEPGRKVKRGWTEPEDAEGADARSKRKHSKSKEDKEKEKGEKEKEKDKKKKRKAERSEFTEGPECLFKTILPANRVPAPPATGAVVDAETGEIDERALKRARKQAKKAREVVVHEFANWARIPTFLKSSSESPAGSSHLEYVDGQGWVDPSSGAVVEPLKSTRPTRVTAVITKEEQLEKRARLNAMLKEIKANDKDAGDAKDGESESETSDSGSDTSSDGSEEEEQKEEKRKETEKENVAAKETPRKDSNSPLATESEPSSPRPKSSGSAKSLTIKIPPPPTTPAAASKIHPLEALYKRPKAADQDGSATPGTAQASGAAKDAPESHPFSFFGAGVGDDDIEEDEPSDNVAAAESMEVDADAVSQPPMTPFTAKEFEWRTVRSAAPTPDTAHPSRFSSFAWKDDDEEDEGEDDDGDKGKADGAPADFQSWFWDNRGDLNRSWKRRRKVAAKDKRYRENRARTERAI